MLKVHDTTSIDLDMIVRIAADNRVRLRVKMHWPIHDPFEYNEWVKFEGKLLPFRFAKEIIEFVG
jgi:hypothetical protein